MLKRSGRWEEVDWSVAIEGTVWGLKGRDLGVLASPHSTLEELYLAGKLAQDAGQRQGAADFRLRQSDFSADGRLEGIPWLGMPVAALGSLDRVLVVGSFLRKDHPLIAHRLRQAAKRGAKIYKLHSADDDWLMPIAGKKIVPPSELLNFISFFQKELQEGKNAAILLGNFAQQHPQAAQIHAAAQSLAQVTNAKVGFLGEAANSVGGYVAGLPTESMDAILARKAFVLLNVEPELDCAEP